MALFSQEMASLSPEVIAERLHFFELQAHYYHWQTSSLGEHLALGDLYELIHGVKDEIVEKTMGYLSRRVKVAKMAPLSDYTAGCASSLAGDIITFAQRLQQYGAANQMPDIENIAQDLSGKTSQIRYRLTLS